MKRLLLTLVLMGAAVVSAYPDRPVRMVVAYPAGGGTDIIARKVAQNLNLGQRIVVDNRGGATGVIGTDIVNGAAADGHTLLMGHITPNAINPGDFVEPSFAPQWKLAPIALTATAPSVLLTTTTAATVTHLLKLPNSLYASDGLGSLAHLQTLALGVRATHVPYKGGADALQGLLKGEVAFGFSPLPVALPWLQDKRLRALAVTSKHSLHGLPTMAECGFKNFESNLWWGLFAPAGTPTAVIEKLNMSVSGIMKDEGVRAWAVTQGLTLQPSTPASFAQFVESEKSRWQALSHKNNKRQPNVRSSDR